MFAESSPAGGHSWLLSHLNSYLIGELLSVGVGMAVSRVKWEFKYVSW